MAKTIKNFQNWEKMWWEAEKGQVHDDLFALMRLMDEKQRYHHTNNLMNFRLYGNANILNLGIGAYMPNDNGPENRVTINLCQMVTDTVASKLFSDNPNTAFLTEGGDHELQKKAKKLEKFCNGIKYHTRYDDKRQQVGTDCGVFGTGCLKIYPQDGKIKCDRVLIDNIRVDDMDGLYGNPRNLYDDRYVARETLAEAYPKFEQKIMKVDVPTFATNLIPLSAQYYKTYRQIRVIEAYRLPSERTGKGGRHVISIENCDLIDEPYDVEKPEEIMFPHVFFNWCPRLVGFYGQGCVEQVRAIQLEMNKLIRTYQTALHLGCIPYVLEEVSSKLSGWSNETMRRVKYQGTAPQIIAPNAVPSDLPQAIEWLFQKAFMQVGTSIMDVTSQKPEGLNSGKAIRDFHDIGTERFLSVGKRWERFDQECSKRFIQAAEQIDAEEEEGFEVCCVNKKFLETIQWSQIKLDQSDYVMQTFPTSGLSKSYSGRLSDVQEMLQAGLIPPEVGRKLLQFPDLEAYTELEDGPYDSFRFAIDEILENGNYIGPEPFQLPYMQLGQQLMGGAYLRAKANKVPEDKLDLMRDWLNAAQEMMTPSAPPPGALPQGGPPMQPQANPMPPPQSNLIPNVPGIPGTVQ